MSGGWGWLVVVGEECLGGWVEVGEGSFGLEACVLHLTGL